MLILIQDFDLDRGDDDTMVPFRHRVVILIQNLDSGKNQVVNHVQGGGRTLI